MEPVKGALTIDHATQAACKEFHEEVGTELEPDGLVLSHLKSGGKNGDVGIFFTATEPIGETHALASAFDALVGESIDGGFVEFSELVLIERREHADATDPPRVDYLDAVVALSLGFRTERVRYTAGRLEQPRCEVVYASDAPSAEPRPAGC